MSHPTMTRHATSRALDMGVTGDEIRQCLEHPESVYKSKRYADTKNHRAGRVVLAIRDSAIVTVGWATRELWQKDLDIGLYGGRTYRGKW